MNSQNSIKIKSFALINLFSLCLLIFPSAELAQSSGGNATSKEKLIDLLKSRMYSAPNIAEVIKKLGVKFQLTPEIERELVSAGARPLVIEAVRNNYRSQRTAPRQNVASTQRTAKNNTGTKTATKTKTNNNTSGDPLSKDVIIALLGKGTKEADVRMDVETRGVDFIVTPQVTNEIRRAGGSQSLINLISKSYIGEDGLGDDLSAYDEDNGKYEQYQNLMQQAFYLNSNRDAAGAARILQQAVQLSPNEPPAYQMLGYIALYAYGNFYEAERNMQKAIDLGGNAVFTVYHDHDGAFNSFCYGSLFISKDRVIFESSVSGQTFEAQKSDIRQVPIYNPFRRMNGVVNGPFRVIFKDGGFQNGTLFSFAPSTNNVLESQLVVRLIGKG